MSQTYYKLSDFLPLFGLGSSGAAADAAAVVADAAGATSEGSRPATHTRLMQYLAVGCVKYTSKRLSVPISFAIRQVVAQMRPVNANSLTVGQDPNVLPHNFLISETCRM